MPAIVRKNERSWAITLISEINVKLQNLGLKIACVGGEATISKDGQSMFPDVLLYGDVDQTQILQGWELKLPDTPITDISFINDARRKAISLGLNSYFLWNFKAGTLYVRNENEKFEIAKQWNETNYIHSRSDVEKYKNEWLAVIENILIDINGFLLTGKIRGAEIGEMVSDTIVSTIVERNKLLVSGELERNSAKNALIEANLSVWWNGVRDEFVSDEANKFAAYAKIVLLNWTNRIIFAHLIKNSHNAAMEINTLTSDTTVGCANEMFSRITASCDFYNVFAGMEYNDLLPEATWRDIIDFNTFLTNNGINRIEQSALQTILERTVAVSQREVRGQFTTPTMLANILVRLSTHDWTGHAIDPCCGTGSILKAILNQKKLFYGVEEAAKTTWGADKFSFPLQIANISMAEIDAINIPNRLFNENVFNQSEGNLIQIVNPVDGTHIEVTLPRFDTIISNLPFVRFENIPADEKKYIDAIREEVYNTTGIELSDRNDYYSYITFTLHKLLKEDGRLGIITSNSWLGTTAGREFFNALNFYYKIDQLHISNRDRWFDKPDVITVISVLVKRTLPEKAPDNENTCFYSWQKSLSELCDNKEEEEAVVNSALLKRELNPKTVKLKKYSNSEIASLTSMNVSLSALFHDIIWLLDIRSELIKISDVFEVNRGERRGWDTMFYPEPGHGIEQCYIKRVLKNARAVTSLSAEPDRDAFCCSKSIEELRALNHTGAINWIKRFEVGVNTRGEPLPTVLARNGLYWYEMKDSNVAEIVTTMNPDKRLFFARFETPSFINQRLIGLRSKADYPDLDLNHALLNSILGMFFIEAVGFGRGLGALDISSTTLRNGLMLNPHLVSVAQREQILSKFEALSKRRVYDTEQEIFDADRIAFDLEVLRAFEIESHLNKIQNTLLSMQRMRLRVRR